MDANMRQIRISVKWNASDVILLTFPARSAAFCPTAKPVSGIEHAGGTPYMCHDQRDEESGLMPRRRTTETQADDLPRYFVWVRGLEGPEPQKWAALDFGIGEWKRPLVLAWLELSDEERQLPLSALARRYPPPRADGP
jgi:hypothetical protein